MSERRVFVNNLHVAANLTGPIKQQWLRDKVRFIEGRAVQMPASDVVVGSQPPESFSEYMLELTGHLPTIHGIVPANSGEVLTDNLDAVKHLFRGAEVYSYIGDKRIAQLVEQNGGRYISDLNPSADDKGFQKPFAVEAGLRVPEGELVTGARNIASAVYRRLQIMLPTYVRDPNGGGGIGNAAFGPEAFSFSEERILQQLGGMENALVEEFLPQAQAFPGVAHGISGWFTYSQILRKRSSVARWLPALPGSGVELAQLHEIGARFKQEMRLDVFDVDLGVLPDGSLAFYEVNNRINGSGATVELVTRLFGSTWQEDGIVVRSMDDFKLAEAMSFNELAKQLRAANLLATNGDVLRKVIPYLPPVGSGDRGKTAGIVIIGDNRDYEGIQQLYESVIKLIGDPDGNKEDALA